MRENVEELMWGILIINAIGLTGFIGALKLGGVLQCSWWIILFPSWMSAVFIIGVFAFRFLWRLTK